MRSPAAIPGVPSTFWFNLVKIVGIGEHEINYVDFVAGAVQMTGDIGQASKRFRYSPGSCKTASSSIVPIGVPVKRSASISPAIPAEFHSCRA